MEVKNKDLNLNDLIRPYIKKWPLFLISIFTILVLAFLFIKSTSPVFKVQTSILVKDAEKMSSAAGDLNVLQSLSGFGGMGTNSIQNELEIFKSKRIIEDVVKDLKLQTPIFAKQNFYDIELYKDTNPFNVILVKEDIYNDQAKSPVKVSIKNNEVVLSSDDFEKDIKTVFNKLIRLPYADLIITKNSKFNNKKARKLKLNDLYFKYSDFESTVEQYQKAISVELLDKDATVVGVNMNDGNVDKAKAILNTLVKKYNYYAINDKNTESEKTKNFIDDRITIISKELGDVESEKQNFKTKNNIVDVQSDARINLEVNQASQKKIIELDTQLELNNMLIGYLNTQSTSQLIPINIGLSNSGAVSSINVYNKLIQDKNRMLETATPENPIVKELNSQISTLRNSIKESLAKDRSSLQISKSNIVSENNRAIGAIGTIPVKERVFRNIERQQQIKENLFLLLLQKREEAAISMAITSDKARVVDYAYAFKKPVSPKKLYILGGALFLGFLLPILYVFIKELFNNKIVFRSDIEKLSSIPVIAEIPRTFKKSDQLLKNNDLSPLAEAFRILVTNLRFIMRRTENAKIIMVTSSMKGEGKTFVSVNLALALTTPNKKVLVIGSDIRNPQLQRYNPSMKTASGLTEFLNDDIENINDIIHPSGFISGTDFIYSGTIPPNPTDLLQNEKYEILLNTLRPRYDYIILDTAPLMPVTDSFLISHLADTTVYIVRSDKSLKDYMHFADKNKENGNLKNAVFVLNDIAKSNFSYGNQYGYSQDKKKWWKVFKR